MPLPRSLFPLLLLAPAFLLAACSPAVTDAQVKDVEVSLEKARAEITEVTATHSALEKEAATLQRFAGSDAKNAAKIGEELLAEKQSLVELRDQVQQKIEKLKAGEAAHRRTLEGTAPQN
jgi:septal ring factor EnvC (AmiA/AmiB activator)